MFLLFVHTDIEYSFMLNVQLKKKYVFFVWESITCTYIHLVISNPNKVLENF